LRHAALLDSESKNRSETIYSVIESGRRDLRVVRGCPVASIDFGHFGKFPLSQIRPGSQQSGNNLLPIVFGRQLQVNAGLNIGKVKSRSIAKGENRVAGGTRSS